MFWRIMGDRAIAKKRYQEFEDRIRRLRRFKDYELKPQRPFRRSGKRPDFIGVHKENRHDRIIIDAKHRIRIWPADVEKVHSYEGPPFYASKSYIYVPRNCWVSPGAKKRAKEKDVTIIRSKLKKHKKRSGFWLWRKDEYEK